MPKQPTWELIERHNDHGLAGETHILRLTPTAVALGSLIRYREWSTLDDGGEGAMAEVLTTIVYLPPARG